MKKICAIVLALFSVSALFAQESSVRLPEKPKNRTVYVDYSTRESGYWSSVDVNMGTTVMFNRKHMQPIHVGWINGYRISEFLKIGVGVGVKYNINNNKVRTSTNAWTFPVYADVRGNFISQQDRGSVPFWAVDLGGEFKGGGVLFSPTLGYRIGSPRSSFIIGISYVLTQYDTWKKENELLSGVSLKLGYEF